MSDDTLPYNKLVHVDALAGLTTLSDESVQLIVTSPPYANVRKSYTNIKPDEYVEWFTPIAKEMLRVLTPDGSFVLNINDKCHKGERSTYVFELVIKLKSLGFKFIDTNIWAKKNGLPSAGRRRSDYFEYIFHFAKSTKPVFNVDEIRVPYAASSVTRSQKPIMQNASNRESRMASGKVTYKKWKLHPRGAWPNNVIFFPKDTGKNLYQSALEFWGSSSRPLLRARHCLYCSQKTW
jgi:site-specific DNA-methyltransferase (adenine-specific)/site-specific DNA-methyltransferase (cytosine-N4-specific)